MAKELSSRVIQWKHIMPYVPWQGVFYERLSESVKYSLYKTFGGSVLTFEELSIVILEIESVINTRPLTLIGNNVDLTQVLLDFIQENVEIILPVLNGEEHDDPLYIPPADLSAIETRNQAVADPETSYKLTETFRHLWQTEYLMSLREKQLSMIETKKGCRKTPREGQLMLICDVIMPRHTWKIGFIENLVMTNKGTVRKVVVRSWFGCQFDVWYGRR
ncbi:Integrase catalytic domain-containing protein [Trichostrongylus colubriformis]|uniref:Integrase catalytic domain-containing protein n=1 Tax=Trichostrongylus colubriformis TaxID=6319 RepID=A0AAN8EWK6_TRICO